MRRSKTQPWLLVLGASGKKERNICTHRGRGRREGSSRGAGGAGHGRTATAAAASPPSSGAPRQQEFAGGGEGRRGGYGCDQNEHQRRAAAPLCLRCGAWRHGGKCHRAIEAALGAGYPRLLIPRARARMPVVWGGGDLLDRSRCLLGRSKRRIKAGENGMAVAEEGWNPVSCVACVSACTRVLPLLNRNEIILWPCCSSATTISL